MKHFIIVFLLLLVSCNYETTINEYSEYSNYSTTTKSEVSYNERKVNVIVTNDAKGVVFETDSIVLYYQDIDICKTFTTQKYYIDSITLNGRIFTQYYTIYSGDIHIPVIQEIPDSINYIDIELYDGCPWYSDSGYKVLQSIQFGDPIIEDWK